MIANSRVNAARRSALMGSAAFAVLAAAMPAHAQDAASVRPDAGDVEMIRISDDVDAAVIRRSDPGIGAPERIVDLAASPEDRPAGTPEAYTGLVRTTPGAHMIRAEDFFPANPQPQIVIANPGSSTSARDATNVTGVGQMVVDQQNGFIGFCTGSLINPRTVLFAAHCVNSRAATAYGANEGGTPISFGFQTDNLPGLAVWFNSTLGGQPNPQRYQSNPDLFLFNVSQVRYHPLSLEPASAGFLYGDIATATLDTPAGNVPTWALLFSALPTPTITAAGSGYNVQIVGYGRHGNAATGSASGVDFRRRVAENIIGGLTDLRTFETFLFGASNSPTQNLYFMDFDDPRRGLSGASPFDFNAFRDNARGVGQALPSEGLTSNGDSGGPLILQNFGSRQLIAGVLSGGYTRFFNGQPANGYGTVSFYQPLFLYWDWIAANNPYRYVTNIAGDRNWNDAGNWVTTLDPNYFIIGPNGQVVNGIPDSPGLEKNGTGNGFGEICFESGGRSQCLNVGTGVFTDVRRPIGSDEIGEPANGADTARADTISASLTGWVEDVAPEAQVEGGATTQALPAATLANGLPGATNFVPNNVDPVRGTGAIGRYFDVTLVANGTTTLNSAVTIDRFMIGGSGARLNITSTGSLTSLIDVRQLAGVMIVNGQLRTPGDYLLAGGGLMGNGRISTPFLTNVLGTITPGTETTIGTLEVQGNLVLSSGSTLFINIGPNGTSDRLSVIRSAPNADDGEATPGGRLVLSPIPGTLVSRRNTGPFTVLTAQGGINGTFMEPSRISAILSYDYIYSANAVQVEIEALPYRSVVDVSNPNRSAYATLLDQNAGVAALSGIYDVLDLVPTAGQLNAALDALAPRTEALRTSMGITLVDNNARVLRDHLGQLEQGNLGGRIAYYGRRVQTAALTLSGLDGATATMSDVAVQPMAMEGRLPERMSGFVAAGYLEGRSQPQVGAAGPNGQDRFDGIYGVLGLEMEVGDNAVVGAALSYTDAEGETVVGGGAVDASLLQSSLYGKFVAGVLQLDAQINSGRLSFDSSRPGGLPGTSATLRLEDDAWTFSGEVGAGVTFGERVRIGPRVALRYSHIDFGDVQETGGVTALSIDREEYSSLQGRAGINIGLGSGRIQPHLSATFVHDFEEQPTTFAANFVGGTGTPVLFGLTSEDRDWGELSGGLSVDLGNLELSFSADTTFDRDNVENQSYRVGLKFDF